MAEIFIIAIIRIILLASITLFSIGLNAPTISEPEFISEYLLLKPDNSTVILEKQTTRTRSAMNAGMAITGFGSIT